MSQRYVKWWLGSCEAVPRANHPHFLLRGGLWAPIIRGDDVVRGEGMEVKR